MIRIRRATVIETRTLRRGLTEAIVEVDGARSRALAYDDLCGPVRPQDVVVLNTTALTLGLGTGGYHFVIAVEGAADVDAPDTARSMKVRYTPVQTAVVAAEEAHAQTINSSDGIDGTPVVAAGLHSALAPVALGARVAWPDCRLVYVMTDAAALPMVFSRTVQTLREAGLLSATITSGQAFGGDLEAVNKFSAIMLAKRVARADVIIVSMGPGNLGTASRYGFAAIEVGEVVNATAALGGTPIAVPRIGFADPRQRHHGVSHHTLTALDVAAYAQALIPIPPLSPERERLVRDQLARIVRRHRVVRVDHPRLDEVLSSSPFELRTMGRGLAEEPDYFRTAASAGVLAGRLAAGEHPA